MKRWLLVFSVLVLLSGCAAAPEQETTVTDPTPPIVQTDPPTEPPGFYDPNSDLEKLTEGAIRVYPLEKQDTYGIVPMGEDLLVFSGLYNTTLTKLSGEMLYIADVADLQCSISPDSPAVQVTDSGIAYYDNMQQELVILDTSLEEVERIALPDDMTGYPALSEDRRFFYYCTDDEVRCLDLETGLNRLVKEMSFYQQELSGIHCGDTILECSVSDGEMHWFTIYLSAQTGELVYEVPDQVSLHTNETHYFATHYDGKYQEMLTGMAGQEPSMLHYSNLNATAEVLMDRNAVVLVSTAEDLTSTTLNYYDLSTGTRRYTLQLPQEHYMWSFQSGAEPNTLWFLRFDPQYGCDTICRWDLSLSQIADDSAYLGVRRSYDNPDLDGIRRCQERARRMSEQYGVEILLWTDAVQFQPWDYSLLPEHRVPLLQEGLDTLEQALRQYPDGFLKKAASDTKSGIIRICLVRSITGNPDADVPESAVGLQFWDEGEKPHVAVELGHESAQSIHHELFHIIESKVISSNSYYDNWEDLNPEGFAYDYDYIANLKRDDYELIEGSTRSFIDLYSMSYPKEDRARIMEYAITEGHRDYFSTAIMQTKLKRICQGIRDAFGLKKSTETYPWEQYLETSLAYKKK